MKQNKYQEALNYLDWHCSVEHKEQQELLQELVDKETPLRVIKLKCYRNEEYNACPKCNTNVYIDDHDYYLERCDVCGQKLDWSDEE